ncbi:hypothetical protein C8Q80DRAFT_739511 [Daedaleopsis nitida]|nr:hypothetical protein C8Q80DRAFT_739511 [Daedaleopsis nitida]
MKAITAASVFALYLSCAAAQTTLFIPGFDPQAITADIEGVDAQGRTTYRIGGGVASGTFDVGGNPPGVSGTLVAGSTEAHLVYNIPVASLAISEDCSINGEVAVCTGVVSAPDGVQTVLETETASGFVVQGNTAAAPTASASANTGGASAAAGTDPASPTAASTNPATPSPSGENNGVARVGSSLTMSLGVVGLVAAFFL